jgi:hypothetical protein
MQTLPSSLSRRLAYILHRGLTEIRNLSGGDNHQQIHDLADALEFMPGHLEHCTEETFSLIRWSLQQYAEKYPQSTYRYLAYLECDEPPERF